MTNETHLSVSTTLLPLSFPHPFFPGSPSCTPPHPFTSNAATADGDGDSRVRKAPEMEGGPRGGGGQRRRPPAARKEGNDGETTRVRFLRTRASTRPRDCIPSTGLGGATPREAGDERRFVAASGNGGEAVPGGGKVLGGACELLGVLRVLPHNLRGGGGAKRENGGELYRDGTGRCDERPTARE